MVESNVGPNVFREWYLGQQPAAVLAITIAGALAGGGLLHIATRLPNALIGLVGVVLATGCAWVTADYTSMRWRDPQHSGWRHFVVACGIIGLALVIVSNIRSWPFPAFAGLVALTIGVSPTIGEVREDASDGAERWMLGGLSVSLVGTVGLAISGPPGWTRLVAFVAVVTGLGFFTGGLSAHTGQRVPLRSPLLRVVPGDAGRRGLVVAGVGVVVAVVGFAVGLLPVALVGGWFVVVAMITLSVRPERFDLSPTMQRTVFGAGAGLVLLSGYQLFTTDAVGRSAWFVTFVVATIALAGAWIVWRGASIFLGVLIGFAFVWGLFSNTTSDPTGVSAEAEGEDVAASGIVAFGDSFISGEGATRFYTGTDQKGAEPNECRRAPTAYPVLVSLGGDGTPADGRTPINGLTNPGLDFVACSGAKLAQVLDTTTDGDDNVARSISCEVRDDVTPGQYPCGPRGVYGSTLQLDHLSPNRDETQLVLISIGGNDVRFGDIVAGCLLPGSCAERREVWLDNVAAFGPELTSSYETIRSTFDPDGSSDVAIVVMPYPLVLTERTCAGSPLDASEHEFIYEFTTVLNQQLATSARQAGVHFFDDGSFAFEGHRLCEAGDRAINLIGLQPTAGPLVDRLNPGSWIHNSMHPNELGHDLTADVLTGWLNDNDVVGGGNPSPDPLATVELLAVRTARPYAVAPSTLDDLRAAPVDGCGFGQLASFATRVAVFDEQGAGDDQPFRVPIAGADPDATICATDSSGRWVALTPSDGSDDMSAPSERPTATVQDGRVFITGGRPAEGCPEIEQDDGACAFQWVLFTTTTGTGTNTTTNGAANGETDPADRAWSLRAVRYCSTDPDCESTFDEWSAAQISQAARKVAPPAAMIFLGGWLLALGWNLLPRRPIPNRLRRWMRSAMGALDIGAPTASP
jgi:hypothetical protein